MKKDISPELIRKYIGGGCTPDETERVHDWYASFEKEADPLIDTGLKEQLELKMRMLGQIRANVHLQRSNSSKRMKVVLYRWTAAAAAVLVVVIGLMFYKSGFKTADPAEATGKPYTANLVRIGNSSSVLQKHRLSDGTVIWLSPLASISYSKGFEADRREVSISGDVFFDVTKDKKRPFVIYGGGLITKVWGTSFSIAYNKITRATEVAVLTGKVSVRSDDSGEGGERRARRERRDHGVMLLPNEKAVYAKNEHKLSKDKIAAGSAVSIWKKEDVLFDNITVNEIVKVLNVKFGVNITVADQALNSYVLKADFTGQSLPEILLIMEKSLNITYSIDGTTIVLRQPK